MTDAPRPLTTAQRLEDLRERDAAVVSAADEVAVQKQHARGKKTARERIADLLDDGSFVETDRFVRHQARNFGIDAKRPDGDGIVTGHGAIDGRQVCVYAQDFTVFGGSLGEAHGRKIQKIQDLALSTGVPVIGILDGGGARIQEGVASLAAFAGIMRRNTRSSGVVPQIAMIMGPAAGGAVYSPALSDFIVMVEKTSHMFITGPDVIRTVTGEDVGFEELGGARTHSSRSGVAHYMAPDEDEAIEYVKDLLSYLPANTLSPAPSFPVRFEETPTPQDTALDALIPDSPNQPYDMLTVLRTILDDEEFLEVQPLFAQSILVGFGRVEGYSVGIIANQPSHLAGTLDIDASEKAARFVRLCDAFNIPVLTFVDVPGFLPGTDQEFGGIIRRGAKLLYAYAEATVPLVTVITRKAYGGAYIVMGSKDLGADINLAWPTAQIAVMGSQGAVSILHRQHLRTVQEEGGDVAAERTGLETEYEEQFATPYTAAERGWIDGVIRPSDTRLEIARALRALRTKRDSLPTKKHGNIPL
ncbi:MAG: acyl-CoA carboxylase subunit beta [Brachybacterium sp.]|uniref:acyl-CoA carboxylase subunit beta n=1 Tax=Brachybacterium sp. TaxID=1891286 RepID=UPI002648D9DB|nr:acyl-CoA carboxylase subunit beta [Brachybacterium sp.]MDN5685565.1 acyl-CoA carboxylase subunit beta [Brachybacterium sp.]